MSRPGSARRVPRAMTIAGSDSGGGAGIQADLKTFAALGVYGMSALTAITAQNTLGVTAVQEVSLDVIAAQIDAVVSDIGVDAVKVGMLSSAEIVELVADKVGEHSLPNLVVDPVMVATSGDRLLKDSAVESLRSSLIPLAAVVTPNLAEAEVLTGRRPETIKEMQDAAARIADLGARTVLVKGGHLEDAPQGEAVDVLYQGGAFHLLTDEFIDTENTHGTGCTLSSGIAAGLAHGWPVLEAVAAAKAYLTEGLRAAFPVGQGHGPPSHLFAWWAGGGADGRGGATHAARRETL
ncbi:MAG: bifunctional hydroxymethylpyrimidine kinase/phosphomethylpyrimidine kinase [Dehalococcoidia bacterium]